MKKSKYLFVVWMLLAITLAGGIFTTVYTKEKDQLKQEGLQVVTSFYPVYIAAKNVIGDSKNVTLRNLSQPKTGCMHDYQLTPQDMILLSQADVFLINGGGIESFLSEAADAYPKLNVIQTVEDTDFIGENAHAWMDTRLYSKMVQQMAECLGREDRENAQSYRQNAEIYCQKINLLTEQIEELKPQLEGTNIVIFHEAFEYVASQYGMKDLYCLNLDEERQVSASEAANVLQQMEDNGITVILAEELYGKAMGDTVEAGSSGRVYYLDTLVRGEEDREDADSYLTGMQSNLELLKTVVGKE